jgi:hypothetical protein
VLGLQVYGGSSRLGGAVHAFEGASLAGWWVIHRKGWRAKLSLDGSHAHRALLALSLVVRHLKDDARLTSRLCLLDIRLGIHLQIGCGFDRHPAYVADHRAIGLDGVGMQLEDPPSS